MGESMGLQVEPYDDDEADPRDGDSAGSGVGEKPDADGELARAKDRLTALENSLDDQARAHVDLIHLLSHELRTPITVINGFLRLLLDASHGELSERQAGFVKETLKATARLDLLVGDLLEASPESGSPLRVEPDDDDLDRTLRSTVDSFAPQLADRGMRVEFDTDAPIAELLFDRARIEQVVTNLMTNAVRYGRVGGEIRVGRFMAESDGDPFVQIYVEDDGPGIPEVDRKRIFEPYVRGDTHSICRGLGIGLAICQRIVESHAGSIRVESGSKGGARFVFALPAGQSASQE